MARRVIGLDLGAYSVKMVRLLCGKQSPKFEIINLAEEIISVDEGDERDLVERQKEALGKFVRLGILEAETFAIGLEASDGHMRSMQVPYLDNRKLEAVLPGLLEAEVPFELDEMVTSWHRTEENHVQQKGVEKPDFTTIRVAFGKKAAIAKTLQMLQTYSVNPRLMHLSSVAPFELIRELNTDALFTPTEAGDNQALSAIVDFGHTATNLCIFDRSGLRYSRSFLRGGKKLTEEISKSLDISFKQAEELKHTALDLNMKPSREDVSAAYAIARAHHQELIDDILRTFISVKTTGVGEVKNIVFIGGGSLMNGFQQFFAKPLADYRIDVLEIARLDNKNNLPPSMMLSFAYALSCLQVHAKESRFNFRKDEFTWRGDLDFLRTKSTPLALWSLAVVCSLTIMWFASSLVLGKENQHVENQLKTLCSEILGQKNIAPKKCLDQMKEQLSASVDLGIPEFSASDVYVKLAQSLPVEPKLTISELDVLEKKMRLIAKTASFEDLDKVVALIQKIPCFVKVEKGRAQQVDGGVEFNLSSDLDCNPALAQASNAR